MSLCERYARQDALTEPGVLASLFDGLPDSPSALRDVVSGLITHVAWAAQYGVPATMAMPRDTQSVADRLRTIQSSFAGALHAPRPAHQRSFGTCRDYALMLCSMLRHRAIPARVRCGFATYFKTAVPYEDHWICEYWSADAARWLRADAQLDRVHRETLGIGFDCADLPGEAFLSAGEAWRLARSGAVDAGAFGHGEEGRGWWFMRVNVHRDLLALSNRQTSAWDNWRRATDASKVLDAADLAAVDDLVAAIERADGDANGSAALEAMAAANEIPSWQF
jgi:hypothetical protein